MTSSAPEVTKAPEPVKLEEAVRAIQNLDYGEVAVVVHAGKVLEVRITRRKRFAA